LFFLLLSASLQTLTAQSEAKDHIRDDVYFLADDKLEGRATGSEGEKQAADYIAKQFAAIGLISPDGLNNYLASFDVNAGKAEGKEIYISLGNDLFKTPDVYPLSFSANGNLSAEITFLGYGISAPDLGHDDYAGKDVTGKIAVIQLSSPEGNNPHSKYADHIDERTKVLVAMLHGAKGVIFFNEDPDYEIPMRNYSRNSPRESVPVLYADKKVIDRIKSYHGMIGMGAELNDVVKTGHNVVGFIDNKSENTVVIGAHYDHLGHGEIEGSLYRGEPAIHNGADDNASGVALIIQLARMLKLSDLKNNNYLFIAFSGEEMGLFGSKAFVKSETIKNYHVNYMLNFDMVGRIDSLNTLIINGAGTSPEWKVLEQLKGNDIHIKTTESGVGPSDQTSFYLSDIPVLHFFTGSHQDYHKPSDDADKINFDGIVTVLDYTFDLIAHIDSKGKIPFTKTNDSNNDDAPKFTVTLGVVPDYAYNGKGMRIDGVSDGKPASHAGLLTGDVVTKLGTHDVSDMMSYMKALSKFQKGDATTVTFLRNGNELTLPIQF